MFDPSARATYMHLQAEAYREANHKKHTAHLMLHGLVDCLPNPGAVLTSDHRQRWMAAAGAIFDYLFAKQEDKP